MKTVWIKRIAQGITIFAAAVLVLGLVVMGLWNALVPELFNGPVLTFWQAIGLLVLSHILLRGGPGEHLHSWRHDTWRKKFDAKLAAMSPEDRARFRSHWHNRWAPPEDAGKEQPSAQE